MLQCVCSTFTSKHLLLACRKGIYEHTYTTRTHTQTRILIMKETVNVTASLGVFVRVRAGIDIVTRVATWELQALDPVTGSHYVKY